MIKINSFILNELNGSTRLINGSGSGQDFSTRLINELGSGWKILNLFKEHESDRSDSFSSSGSSVTKPLWAVLTMAACI